MGNRIIVMGASLSGIQALSRVVSNLPANFSAPILIVQHVAAHSPGMLPTILNQTSRLRAIHPHDAEEPSPGVIYVAPPDRHMVLDRGRIRLCHGPKENFARPAIDPLFRSAAMNYGKRAIGVILTGQLDDGTAGLLAIKDCGGTTIVQEPSDATAPSMPLSALRHVPIDHRCTVSDLAPVLVELAADPQPDRADAANRLIEIEANIASGRFTVEDWWQLERLASPSGLNCPECMAPLYELADVRVMRFRCRSGHAFSAQSLLSGQAGAREDLLASLFSALLEEATLARRMARRDEYASDGTLLARLEERVTSLEQEAGRIQTLQRAMTGLVEPEPLP